MMLKVLQITVLILALAGGAAAAAEDTVTASQGAQVDVEAHDHFAIIDGERIAPDDYVAFLRKAVRERYFHGRVARREMVQFRQDTAEQLVAEILLSREARRNKLTVDTAVIEARLAQAEDSLAQNEGWEERKPRVMGLLRRNLERELYVTALRREIGKVPEPDSPTLMAYYEANKDKFTTPEKIDVSLIMLSVDPSSGNDVWLAAVKEGEDLAARIRKGAKFEDLARIHSSDESALRGGHMGFQHVGMLAEQAQGILAIMNKGDISEPVMMLQGVAIFRLNDRQPATLNPLSKVRDRAIGLWQRDEADKRWKALVDKLRKAAKVTINQELVNLVGQQAETAPGR